jgi:ATP-binding cassette subfamily C (CFTR/MRP) protein 1
MRLVIALARVMKWQLLIPIFSRLAKIGFDFCQPFLIQAFQVYLSQPHAPELAREDRALISVTVLIYLGIAASIGIHQYYN